MSYFKLPNLPYVQTIPLNISFDINNTFDDTVNDTRINKTLVQYLHNIKSEIDDHGKQWDMYKKYTNSYEFIHTNIPCMNISICKLKPLSRSFFKLIEMNKMINLTKSFSSNCKTFHLAEGPGGFIEAISYIRNNKNDKYYGMTLINDNNHDVPGWRKTKKFLDAHPNVIIDNGITGDGDLFKIENLNHCYRKYGGTMDLITADGGFDFSVHFNNQESDSINLILCQVTFAIAMQKKGGTFVVKMFDTFTQASLGVIYLLSLVYSDVHFVKPNTSRSANSEKYLICEDFKLKDPSEIINNLTPIFSSTKQIQRLFSIEIPYFYKCKVEEYNAIFGQQQIETIATTLNLMNKSSSNERLDIIKNIHIKKCVSWCKKCDLPINEIIDHHNVFNKSIGRANKAW